MGDRARFRTTLTAGITLLLLAGCSGSQDTTLRDVIERGELHVATRNTDSTYYEGPHGATGIEYNLASGFAEELGVALKLHVAGNVAEVLRQVEEGEVDFAAAGLTITRPRLDRFRFTPSYQSVIPQLVYRSGHYRPQSLADIDGQLEVIAGSSHVELLESLKPFFPDLEWFENRESESEDLLTLVSEGVVDYTVLDSNEIILNQHFYPELRVAFNLSDPQPLAWAFPPDEEPSLFEAANRYLRKMIKNGRINALIDRHYGHLEDFDYVGTRTFMRDIRAKLPRYRTLFETAAKAQEIDWRLLAALAYQESHWDPKAVSPTGVRGMMMLTRAAAEDLGITRRTDAKQSIEGGSRYLRRLLDKIPERITMPDRLWLGLAAYNIGYGHLEDARILTQRQGGNPDEWQDVRERLPLLRQRKWYRTLKRGYARGGEAVQYVENIRSYYQILVWNSQQEQTPPPAPPAALEIANPVL